MLKKIVLLMSLLSGMAIAQSVTPNIGLQLPAYNSSNWGTQLNYDLTRLDGYLGGQYTIPNLAINTLTTPTVNATVNGYQINGTAPLNHFLIGNGTYYVDSAVLPAGSLPTSFSQLQVYGSSPFIGFAATSGGTNTAGITGSNNVFAFGNGTAGDASGALDAATVDATQSVTTPSLTDTGLSTVNDCVLVGTGGLLTEGSCSAAALPTGTTNQLLYYQSPGTAVTPLNLGPNLSIVGGTLDATGAANAVNYNPPNTNYEFYGDSKFIVSSSCIVSSYGEGTITAWSIASNVLTLTAANTQSAGNVVTLSGFPTSTFLNGQIVTVLSTGLSGTQFEANFTHANGGATESGTYACTYSWPHQFSQEPFALNHGSVINYGIAGATSATLDADYATDIHPSSPAVTGNPGFLFLHTGANDFIAGLSLATVEANLQTLWADAHVDGWTVVQYTDLPWGGFGTSEQAGLLFQAQLNQWIIGQSHTSSSATGEYWDKLIDVAQPLNNPFDANMVIQSGADNFHNTDAGNKVAADFTNQAMGVQGSQFTAINGANIFLGPQRIAFNQSASIAGPWDFLTLQDTETNGGSFLWHPGVDVNNLGYIYTALNGTFASSWHMVGGNYPAFTLPSWGMIGFNQYGSGSGGGVTFPPDTSITRDSAAVMDVGQGFPSIVAGQGADKAGSINLLNLTSLGTTTETFCAGNAPCTNQANTFKVGTQTVSSGTSGTVAQVVQGSAFAQPALVWTVAGATSTSFVAPSNVVAGDALILIVGLGTTSSYTVTDTLGNTFVRESTQVMNGEQVDIWVAVNSPAGADTVTTSVGVGGHLSEFTGVATATPVDAQTSVGQANTPGIYILGPLTTTQYDLFVTVVGTGQYPDTAVIPAQYTTLNAWTNPVSGLDFASAYATLPAGANVATWTGNGPQAGGGILLALKAASTSGQTADLTDYKNAAGTVVASVGANGAVTTPTVDATVSVTTPVVKGSDAATFAAGSGAGTSPTAPACLTGYTCTASSGTVSITTGTSPNNTAALITVSFTALPAAYANCVVSGFGTSAGATILPYIGGSNATSFSIWTGNTPAASTLYEFSYVCQQ